MSSSHNQPDIAAQFVSGSCVRPKGYPVKRVVAARTPPIHFAQRPGFSPGFRQTTCRRAGLRVNYKMYRMSEITGRAIATRASVRYLAKPHAVLFRGFDPAHPHGSRARACGLPLARRGRRASLLAICAGLLRPDRSLHQRRGRTAYPGEQCSSGGYEYRGSGYGESDRICSPGSERKEVLNCQDTRQPRHEVERNPDTEKIRVAVSAHLVD